MGNRRKKGNGTVRQRVDGRWEERVIIAYTEEGKPKYKSVFGVSKPEVQQKLKDIVDGQTIVPGVSPEKTSSDMKFGEWLDFWYRSYSQPGIRQTTQENYEYYIYRHIIPEIGGLILKELTQNDLQEFYSRVKTNGRQIRTEKFGAGVSDRVVRGCHSICRKCLAKAAEQGMIDSNPALGCKLPPKKAREMQVLTHDELRRFLMQAHYDGYYEFYLLEFSTGLRRGEICGLQWSDLDAGTGELHVQRQVASVNGGVLISEPKTKSSDRIIRLSPSVLAVINALRERSESRWMFPSPVKEDTPYNPQSVYRKTRQILERSGCKKVRFHDLRHRLAGGRPPFVTS